MPENGRNKIRTIDSEVSSFVGNPVDNKHNGMTAEPIGPQLFLFWQMTALCSVNRPSSLNK